VLRTALSVVIDRWLWAEHWVIYCTGWLLDDLILWTRFCAWNFNEILNLIWDWI